jgi:hypothetical protein
MASAQVDAMETLLDQYEKDIDQAIVSIVGENEGNQGIIVVAKKFLDRRKAAVDPKRSLYEVYEIIDTEKKKVVSLLTVPVDEKLIVGNAARGDDEYIIPVVRSDKIIEVYKYKLSTGLVTDVEIPEIDTKYNNILSVFATSHGFFFEVPSGGGVALIYHSNRTKKQIEIPLLGKDNIVISINDVIEQKGTVFITGLGTGSHNPANSYVWIYSFQSDNYKKVKKTFLKLKENDELLYPKFISTMDSSPSILLSQRASINNSPVMSILNFDGEQETVWNTNTSNSQDDENYSVSGICNGQFMILRKNTMKKPFKQLIDFLIVSKDGTENKFDIETLSSKDNYSDVMVKSINNFLYVLINFNRFEDVRRSEGWYSWIGYSVNKLELNAVCNPQS